MQFCSNCGMRNNATARFCATCGRPLAMRAGNAVPAPGGNLSYGQRKLLEFAAALIPDPDLVMLDEPAAAVNPTMIERMKHYIRTLNQSGKTFLIVEHNMDVVMDLSHRVVVLDIGRKIAEGSPAEIQRNVDVQEAYFGR